MHSKRLRSLAIMMLLAVGPQIHAAQTQGPTCQFPDISATTPVPLEPGASPAAGDGGNIPGGRWELITVRYDSFLTITGEAIGALEMASSGPLQGEGSVALDVTITSPTSEQISETGAGPYSATGTVLSFQNDCGGELLLGEAEYSVDTSAADPLMTLWGEIEITDPFPTTIPIETEFLLVEPASPGDEIFKDRFEQP